jgi:hypothetical protein
VSVPGRLVTESHLSQLQRILDKTYGPSTKVGACCCCLLLPSDTFCYLLIASWLPPDAC